MATWSERQDSAGAVLRHAGLAIAQGMAAYGAGDWSAAVTKLSPLTEEVWRLSDSHTRRQLYTVVLNAARSRAV